MPAGDEAPGVPLSKAQGRSHLRRLAAMHGGLLLALTGVLGLSARPSGPWAAILLAVLILVGLAGLVGALVAFGLAPVGSPPSGQKPDPGTKTTTNRSPPGWLLVPSACAALGVREDRVWRLLHGAVGLSVVLIIACPIAAVMGHT